MNVGREVHSPVSHNPQGLHEKGINGVWRMGCTAEFWRSNTNLAAS